MCDTEGFNCLFLLFSAGSWALSFISQSASSLLFLCVCVGGGHCKDTCVCRIRISALCPICLLSLHHCLSRSGNRFSSLGVFIRSFLWVFSFYLWAFPIARTFSHEEAARSVSKALPTWEQAAVVSRSRLANALVVQTMTILQGNKWFPSLIQLSDRGLLARIAYDVVGISCFLWTTDQHSPSPLPPICGSRKEGRKNGRRSIVATQWRRLKKAGSSVLLLSPCHNH